MFEIEAEEYVIKKHNIDITKQSVDFSLRCEFAEDFTDFQKGAEFGYNKANEWHYVKDGDYPKEDNRIMLCYCRKGYHGNVGIYVYRLFTKQEFMKNKVIAWKEIVLPKESEECTH